MEIEKRVLFPEDKADKFDPYERVDLSKDGILGEYLPKFDPYKRDIKEVEILKLPCKNEHLEGKEHPVTGVLFVKKIVEDINGNKIEVVVPVFDSVYDAKLPSDLLQASDKQQAKECNNQLKEAVENNPEFASKFTKEQLEQIKNGDTPDGYTWHHNEELGKMQLVDSDIHNKTGHTGGKVIWGGGQENR